MRKALVRKGLAGLAILALAAGGCCSNPDGAAKARQTLQLMQATYYTASGVLKPEIQELGQVDAYVALGAALADQALALAGALQEQNCPDPAQVAAAAAKAAEARKLAAAAGVK